MPTLKAQGSMQVQSSGGPDQDATIVRGLAAHLRQTTGAIVEERESALVFSNARLGMRWLVLSEVIANQGEIGVCSFGQLTTVSYTVELEASAFKPAMALALCGGAFAYFIGPPTSPALAAIVFGFFGYVGVYRMLRSASGWFELQLSKMVSSASYA